MRGMYGKETNTHLNDKANNLCPKTVEVNKNRASGQTAYPIQRERTSA